MTLQVVKVKIDSERDNNRLKIMASCIGTLTLE